MQKVLIPTALFLSALATAIAAQDIAPGLTGVDRPDDVIVARQLLMDGIDDAMREVDLAAAGKEFKLSDLQARAFTIHMMLTAFPHLFPPQTKPTVAADGSPSATSATLAVWEDFGDFYSKAQDAAALAFEASQAKDLDEFRELAVQLRGDCDGCHARYMRASEPQPPP
jgi:cytochrome c556